MSRPELSHHFFLRVDKSDSENGSCGLFFTNITIYEDRHVIAFHVHLILWGPAPSHFLTMSDHEEGVMTPKPPPFARAPSFEVVIDPMDEPWEWPAKQEKNTEDNSDDSDDDFFGRGSAASNEEVVFLCF